VKAAVKIKRAAGSNKIGLMWGFGDVDPSRQRHKGSALGDFYDFSIKMT